MPFPQLATQLFQSKTNVEERFCIPQRYTHIHTVLLRSRCGGGIERLRTWLQLEAVQAKCVFGCAAIERYYMQRAREAQRAREMLSQEYGERAREAQLS